MLYLHPKFSNELGFWRREPRLVMDTMESSLLPCVAGGFAAIFSFAQNFFKNSLNQSVIRDHLGNYLVNNVIVSGDVLMAELYNNIQEGFYFCNNNN